MDFEKKLKEIEGISEKLQRDEVGISEGIALFEKSVVLAKECMGELASCRNKIDIIKKELDRALGGFLAVGDNVGESAVDMMIDSEDEPADLLGVSDGLGRKACDSANNARRRNKR